MLIDSCSGCGERISTVEVVGTCCSKCNQDLKCAATVDLTADEVGIRAQSVLADWLLGSRGEGTSQLTTALSMPEAPRNVLYKLLYGLRYLAMQAPTGCSYVHQVPGQQLTHVPTTERSGRLSPFRNYLYWTTAFKALADWPNGFFQFLQANSLEAHLAFSTRAPGHVGNLQRDWLNGSWSRPEYKFVQTAFDTYFANASGLTPQYSRIRRFPENRALLGSLHYVTVRTTAYFLNADKATVKRLLRGGQLKPSLGPEDVNIQPDTRRPAHGQRYLYIETQSLIALLDSWTRPVPLGVAARMLGVQLPTVLSLIESKQLFAEPEAGSQGTSDLIFSMEELVACIDALTKHTLRTRGLPNFLESLGEAAARLAYSGVSEALILRFVAEGSLQSYVREVDWPLSSLRLLYVPSLSEADLTLLISPGDGTWEPRLVQQSQHTNTSTGLVER